MDFKDLNFRYNKYYNRSGVIFRFRHKTDKLSSFFIFTKSKIGNANILSDFGGERDNDINPVENMFREFIEESTYVSDINENPILKDFNYIQNNSFLTKNNFDKVVKIIQDVDFHVIYNEQKNVLNYLYIVDLGVIDEFQWNGIKIKPEKDYQEINIHGSNHHNEISSIVLMKKRYFLNNFRTTVGNKSEPYFRYIIWESIIKNFSAIEVVDQIKSSKIRIDDNKKTFEENKKNYKIDDNWDKDVKNVCKEELKPLTITTKQQLNDSNDLNFQCFEIKIDKKTNIRYIEIPKDYNFYKAMTVTTLDNSDLNNNYASSPTWYGDLLTSMSYIPWAKEKYNKDWKIYVYKTLTPIKLILLMDTVNLGYVYNKIREAITNSAKIHNSHIYDQSYQTKKIASLGREIKTLKITTGFNVIYENQLKLLENRGIGAQILKRKRLVKKMIRYCLGYENCHSDLYFDLNRISPLLSIDKKLVAIICKYINVDGYYVHTVPSLWHLGDVFHGEMAVCMSRNLLGYDKDNIYNNEESNEYQTKLKIAVEKYKNKKIIFTKKTILIDYEVILNHGNLIINFIKKNRRKFYFIIYSDKTTMDYKKILKNLEKLKINKDILNIYLFVSDVEKFINEKWKVDPNIDRVLTVNPLKTNIMIKSKNVPVINILDELN